MHGVWPWILMGALGCGGSSKPAPSTDSASADSGGESVGCAPWVADLQTHWDADALWPGVALPELGGNAGVGVGDLNGDGWPDAVIATPLGTRLLVNDGAGRLAMGVDGESDAWPEATGVALADLDGDGDLDAWLGTMTGRPDLLLLNDGTGTMEVQEIAESLGESTSGSFADVDQDGDLDVLVARYAAELSLDGVIDGTMVGEGNALYINEGGTFTWKPDALPAEVVDDVTFHAQWLDANQDGHPDIYLANDFGPFLGRNRLLLGDGSGQFELADDCGCDLANFGMGVGVGDANGDGWVDLYITDLAGPDLLLGQGDGTFYDATLATGAHVPNDGAHLASWGTAMVDLNGDGWTDLPMVFGRVDPGGEDDAFGGLGADYESWIDGPGQEDVVLMHDGDGGFYDASSESGFSYDGDGRALAVGDFDRDGRPDLITAGLWYAQHWRGGGGCDGRVVVALPGDAHARGLGAQVEATVGDRVQTHWFQPSTTWSSSEAAVFIGLGDAEQIDALQLRFADGSQEQWSAVPAGTWVRP